MNRQFAIILICHLIICHSVLTEPNPAQIWDISIAKRSAVLTKPRNQRIIGGGPAMIEDYPYVASLQQNGTFFGHDFEHFCGGNIIGEKWILTAAKCCYGKDPSQFHVRVGSKFYYMGGRIHEIEAIEIHPNYDQITWDYDVGLLKLYEAIIFSETVQPIELPKVDRDVESGTVLEIAGWGSTRLLGIPSDNLNRNSISTISRDDCKTVYSKNSLTDRMFCIFDEGQGPCIGDTGSPAVIKGVIIGVASWSQSCAYKYPTAYARLPEMVDWIIKVTEDSPSEAGNNGSNSSLTSVRANQ